MRKIITITFVTLDGVMQAPGGNEEDKADGFEWGGWQAPYVGDLDDDTMGGLMQPADYLLGRKTFEIWEDYWPKHADIWPGINQGMKYVMSTTRDKSDWEKTTFLKSVEDIKKLKDAKGPDLQVWGSSRLIQLLLKSDLIDEMWIITHPLTLGTGKKLFAEGTSPAAFTLLKNFATSTGVIFAHYKRAGEVKTGTVGE